MEVTVVLAILGAGVPATPDSTLRAMTYNIHQTIGATVGYTSPNAQKIARIVNYYQPDVLVINELEGSSTSGATNSLKLWANTFLPYLGGVPDSTYFYYVSPTSDGFNRNAMLSRYPILDRVSYPMSPRDLLCGTIDLPGSTDLRLFAAHFKAGNSSSDATTRQWNADFTRGKIVTWSEDSARANSPYLMCGDLNEDEDHPQSAITGTYHPISTVLSTYLSDFEPDNLYGSTKTISSYSTPTRRFDYVLPSWHLTPISGAGQSQVINTMQMYGHGQLPNGLQVYDSQGSDHLCVLATFTISENRTQDCRILPDGSPVSLTAKTVTASFSDCFYVEEQDRSAAIRINSTAAPPVNSIANVTGALQGSGAERFIAATGVRTYGTGLPVPPLALGNRSVGGSDLNPQTPGVEAPYGPFNIGLLVRISGRVSSTFTGGFYLDDGSGFTVKVYSSVPASAGHFLAATGVVGYEKPVGQMRSIRMLRTRGPADVRILS